VIAIVPPNGSGAAAPEPKMPWSQMVSPILATLGLGLVWIGLFMVMKPADGWAIANTTLTDWGGAELEAMRNGQWWRVAMAALLTGTGIDMLFHAWFLYSAGGMIERILGPWTMLLTAWGGAIGAAAVTLYRDAGMIPLSGAAVWGCIGGNMGLWFRYRKRLNPNMWKMFFGWAPLLILYIIGSQMGFLMADPSEFIGGLCGGFFVPLLLPSQGHMRAEGDFGSKPSVTIALAIAALAFPMVGVGGLLMSGGVAAPTVISHPSKPWSVAVPSGLKSGSEDNPPSIIATDPGLGWIATMRADRALVGAGPSAIRDVLRKKFGAGAGAQELVNEELPIGNESWRFIRAKNKDGSLSEAMSCERLARAGGVMLYVEGPAGEAADAMHEVLLKMAETVTVD